MKNTLLFILCSFASHFLHGQTYLDSLYGTSATFSYSGDRGAYEIEDASIVFAYTSRNALLTHSHIRISRIKGDGELVFDKGVNDITIKTGLSGFIRTLDGNFMACGYSGSPASCYLVKFSPLGDEIWSRSYPTPDPAFDSHCATVYSLPDGGFLLAGNQLVNDPESDFMPAHALVIRVDSTGEEIWRNTYGFDYRGESINSIAPTPDGGFLLAGNADPALGSGSLIESDGLLIKIDSLGNQQWIQRYGEQARRAHFRAIQPTQDGNFLITGSFSVNPGNFGADWVLKVDAEGNILWDRTYMDMSGSNWLQDFVQLPDGSIVAAGSTSDATLGSRAGFLIKISAEGDSLWSHIYDRNPGEDLFYSINATMDGGFVMGGFSRQPDGSSQDAWILKVDSFGCSVSGCLTTDVEEEPVLPVGSIQVWPNPFDDGLRIRLPAPVGSMPAQLKLYALSGQLVWEKTLPPGTQEIQAALNHLPPGAYFLTCQTPEAPALWAKVIKAR